MTLATTIETRGILIAAVFWVGTFCAVAADGCAESLAAAKTYPDGGGYNLKSSPKGGVPEKVTFAGTTLFEKSTNGTYCSGFTFAVVIKAAAQRKLLENKTLDQIRSFQASWYGASTNKKSWEKQCVLALTELGVGKEVRWQEAKPGDFIQVYKDDTIGDPAGHSFVFLDWIRVQDKIVGIKFRSSQTKTDGVGDAKAYLKDANVPLPYESFGYRISTNRIYSGRLN